MNISLIDLKRQYETIKEDGDKAVLKVVPSRTSVPRWKRARGGRSTPGGPSTPPP